MNADSTLPPKPRGPWLTTALVWLAAAGTAGAAATNRQCLGFQGGAAREVAVCFAVSLLAPPMAPLIEVDPSLARLRDDETQASGWVHLSPWASARAAPWPLADGDGGRFSEGDRRRFNECVDALYEDPALRLQAHYAATTSLSLDDAGDAVMDALLSVCERAITVPIRDLRPYYSRAARNRVMDRLRHGGRERPCEEVPELKQECWTDVPELTQGEQRWFDEAMCRVSNDQRDVIERWSQGGSWEDIGRDLGMTAAKAANTFHSAIRKLRRHVDARRCEAPARPSRSPLWGSTPPSGFGLSGD